MKKNRVILFIAVALVACLAITGTALAGPKSAKTSKTCPSSTSTTRATTTGTTCPATTSTTRCTCPSTTAKPTCSTTTTVKPAPAKDAKEKNMSAKAKFGTITGSTRLKSGYGSAATSESLAHVHVRLINEKGKVVRTAQSKKDGAFVFKNVKPGTYTLKATSKCYKPANTMTVKVVVEKGKTINIPAMYFKK